MTTFNHDAQGFLVGQVLDTQRQLLRGQMRELALLQSIDASLKARGIGRSRRRTSSAGADVVPSVLPTVIPAGRSPRVSGGSRPAAALATVSPAGRTSAAVAAAGLPVAKQTVSPTGRDGRGRFVGKGGIASVDAGGKAGGGSSGSPPKPPRNSSGDDSKLSEVAKSVKDMAKGAAENIDPTIQAAKEIKDTISPLGRGWRAAFGKSAEQKKERWYKRILSAITGRKVEGVAGTSSSDGGGLGEAALGMVGRLLPALGAVLGPVLAVVLAGLAGLGIGKLISDWLVSSGAQTKIFDAIDSMKKFWSDLKGGAGIAVDDFLKGWSPGDAGAGRGSLADPRRLDGGGKKSLAERTGEVAGGAFRAVTDPVKKAGELGVKAGGLFADALGSVIARHEGNYGSFNRGKAGDSKGATIDFSQMTVSDLLARQALPRQDKNRLFAVGKYQMIPSTFKEAVNALGIAGDEKVTPELQERIFNEFLISKKRPAIGDFIKGKSSDLESAVLATAKEWASVADPATGKSYYSGSGGNRAGTSAAAVREALMKSRSAYTTSLPTLPMPSIPSGSVDRIPSIPEVSFSGFDTGEAARQSSIFVQPEIGQNVADRGIANIVTGGMGKL